jgi:hypothetical protein
LDSGDDGSISGTSAQIAVQSLTDALLVQWLAQGKQLGRRHQHPRSAESTLRGAMVEKRLLEVVQLAAA